LEDLTLAMRSVATALALLLMIVMGVAASPSAELAAVTPDSRIMFARDSAVPRPVQEFAWRIIETRCNYQGYERGQRTFWAYHTQATRLDTGLAYSIDILSERSWKKSEPPATIQMTILDDGRLRVVGLSSTFVGCR
jgi:hypothetical protein